MRTDFMASKKQIAWRKKFARMAKAGKFKKSKSSKKAKPKKITAQRKKLTKGEQWRESMGLSYIR